MKKNFSVFLALYFCTLFLVTPRLLFAQNIDDKQEMREEVRGIEGRAKLPPFKFTTNAGAFFGYDSNVNLSPLKKGDLFEEGLLSAAFSKYLFDKSLRLTVNYDFDALVYNEMTDATNILNHVRMGLHKRIFSSFDIGTGYDLSAFYYPHNEDGTFLFHKCFAYTRQYLSRKFYHQLMYNAGYKIHTDRKALAVTPGTYQNKELESRRHEIEYSVAALPFKGVTTGMSGRFTINDSNAKYLNFYDYKTYEAAPYVSLRLTDRARLNTSFRYIRRNYKSRIITTGTGAKEHDNIYLTTVNLKYNLNQNNVLSLIYTYRDNSTNEPLEEYQENVISVGWQYYF